MIYPSPSRLNSGQVFHSELSRRKYPLHVLLLPQSLALSQPVINSPSPHPSVLPLDHEFLGGGRPYILLSFILTTWHRARFIADNKQMSVAQMNKSSLSSLHMPTTENSELCALLPFGRDLPLKVPILGKRNFHVPRNTRCFPALAMSYPELLQFWFLFFILVTVGNGQSERKELSYAGKPSLHSGVSVSNTTELKYPCGERQFWPNFFPS